MTTTDTTNDPSEFRVIGGCVFCDIIADHKYERRMGSVVMFTPLNPVVLGHKLFVPVHHAGNASDHPWGAADAVYEAAAYVRDNALQANIITSIGGAATQTVFHTHIHLVPRVDGDGLHLPWTGQEH